MGSGQDAAWHGERHAEPARSRVPAVGSEFELEITRQGWIEPDLADRDLCSHGDVRVVIGGHVVASGEDGEYGISEAALALLRTVDRPHTADDPVAEHLIPHGCGTILMMGCPIGLDWDVRHSDGTVLLSNPTVYPTVAKSDAVEFEPVARVPLAEYRDAVVAFASRAKKLFDDFGPKVTVDDWEREQHEEFWNEFKALLSRHSAARAG